MVEREVCVDGTGASRLFRSQHIKKKKSQYIQFLKGEKGSRGTRPPDREKKAQWVNPPLTNNWQEVRWDKEEKDPNDQQLLKVTNGTSKN